ncbi:uncharacterized protein B0H18DRAFT_26650 [Fomitopsis serialis]|uniref:uncharacterized protein n=1 Tax=Fomitopsis serialis TaxID=139415 RepID=UPI002008CD64|nr:uncharacterized protein B0H18DRAFT_26650 [Neoantrodia serialis]KAH9932482.1 hypothetical protein B0H18DRAFT_26650 [Neoantrodia serialis]
MDLHRATSPGRVGDGAPAVQEPAETPRRASEGYTASSRMRSAAVAFAMFSATYYLNILILIDVAFAMLYEQSYGRWELIRMWDALLVGQFIGQIVSGISCDTFGEEVSLCASLVVLFVGAVLCAVARGVQASIIAFEVVDSMVTHKERAFVLLTNGVFNAGGLLATIIFLIVLSAAQPGHLATVWPVCIGIGIVVPFAAISYSILRVMARRGRAMRYMSMYSSEFKRHWITMARTCLLWYEIIAITELALTFISVGLYMTL